MLAITLIKKKKKKKCELMNLVACLAQKGFHKLKDLELANELILSSQGLAKGHVRVVKKYSVDRKNTLLIYIQLLL